ncbi:MAG: hypothetical protein JRG73_16285 [Deltaproteobacteria bacterium]|nr:hypothetical protein [Deltaproteobacteria bacterium]
MKEKWTFTGTVQQIATALVGISHEMKRFNDLQEKKLTIDTRGAFKKIEREKAGETKTTIDKATSKKQPPLRKPKHKGTQKLPISEILYNAIIVISKEKSEFMAREVINHAMQSSPDVFQKQSLNTAFQSLKIGSKKADKQPLKYRDLIIPVEGQRGAYRLNPDKMPL